MEVLLVWADLMLEHLVDTAEAMHGRPERGSVQCSLSDTNTAGWPRPVLVHMCCVRMRANCAQQNWAPALEETRHSRLWWLLELRLWTGG